MKSPDEMQKEWAAAIAKAGVATEQEMREADVPWPESEGTLLEYIRSVVDRPHDYGTCVYAMSMAAVAAYYYVAKKLGVTGFQASCADMDILRRIRGMNDGFRLIDYADLMYPQYWDEERTPVYRAVLADPEARSKFAKKAAEKLGNGGAAGAVEEHWKMLAEGQHP